MRWTEQQLADFNAKNGDRPGGITLIPPGDPLPTPAAARHALGRLKTGEMNKTEAAYAEHLASLRHAGKIQWFKFEGLKFRLADNTFYTPDFEVMAADGVIEIHEVKGFWEDDARVKIKVAADLYPFRFKAFRKIAAKNGGGWAEEAF